MALGLRFGPQGATLRRQHPDPRIAGLAVTRMPHDMDDVSLTSTVRPTPTRALPKARHAPNVTARPDMRTGPQA